MVGHLGSVTIKRLTRLVRVDGKVSMIGIQQALSMSACVKYPIFQKLTKDVSYDSRDSRWNKQDAELVSTFTNMVVQSDGDPSLGNQFQKDVRSWLSPPDPSTNNNTARRDRLEGTASWFTQSDRFKEWTEIGTLFWIHGKRTRFFHFPLVTHPHSAWEYTAGSGKSILW